MVVDYMKFMKSSEPFFLPKDIGKVREIMKKFDKSCIVIKSLDIYFIGRPIISKSNSVFYTFEEIGGRERRLAYSDLREMWIPRNLCPEQLRIF
jgi:hypothetical protein